MTAPRTRRRSKLAPDPDVRRTIVAAASEALREQGVRGLSVAAVLDRAELSTRAFYRHFESKDQLVAAVFLEMAHAEKRRLQRKMAKAGNPVEAVAAWIDGRLDLAFDENIKSDLRLLSLEAQSQMFAAPELIQPAFEEILKPLIEQLNDGLRSGVFHDIDPVTEAQSIQGVVWASTERQWAAANRERAEVRRRALRFCLRGLGVKPEIIADDRRARPTVRSSHGPGSGRIDRRRHRRQQGYGAGDRADSGSRRSQRRRDGPRQGSPGRGGGIAASCRRTRRRRDQRGHDRCRVDR